MATETPTKVPSSSASSTVIDSLRAAGRRTTIASVLERGALPLLLVGLIILFSLLSETGSTFTSSGNVKAILGNQSVTGIIALAMVVPLVAGYFDLSVSAVAGLANVGMASAIAQHHTSVLVGIIVALAIGLIAGAVNGLLVAGLKLDALVVTLGTYTFAGGLIQLYTKGTTIINGIPLSLSGWSAEKWLGVPKPFVLLIVVAVIVWYVLMHMPFGRKLESIGSNSIAARLVGIRVEPLVFASFLVSGLLAAIAGILLTSSTGSANPTAGPSYLFAALAAVFIGSTAIRPGRYNVWGTMFGVFLVAVAVDGFTLLGAESWVNQVFNGGALVIAVAVSSLMGRRRESQARKASLRQVGTTTAPPPAGPAAEPSGGSG
jgi:ribose transport system permease protein